MTEQEFNEIKSLITGLGGITEFKSTADRVEKALNILDRDKQLLIHGVVVPKGTLFCGKENKTCEYLKSDNKCGLRKRWCTYQAK